MDQLDVPSIAVVRNFFTVFINVIFSVNRCDVVPVRAVPHLTGGHIGPLGIAQLLADPNHEITAYELSKNTILHKMLPKNWNQFKSALASPAQLNSDVANLLTTAKLPASTFVYLTDLQRVYEEYYLPSRGDLADYTAAERENFQLQPHAFVPNELVDLVFEGFSALQASSLPVGSQSTVPLSSTGPGHVTPTAQKADTWSIKKPMRRDPLTDVLFSVLTTMRVTGQARPKAREVLDTFKGSKPVEILEVSYEEIKYEASNGTSKLVTIHALQKRLDKLIV